MLFGLLLLVGAAAALPWENAQTRSAAATCECGLVNRRRIVGGRETQRNEYPLMAAVESTGGQQFCGGTIITAWHVLTAAHCTRGLTAGGIQVRVGAHDRQAGGRVVRIARIIDHPGYARQPTVNDISLLVTAQQIAFNQHVGAACVPARRVDFTGQRLRAIGWGMTTDRGQASNVLREVDLTVIPMARCQRSWAGADPATNLCTFEQGQDTCQGDSGGPLLSLNPATNRYTIAALVSYGGACASNTPGVNADVGAYMGWIRENVASSQPQARLCTGA